MGGYLTAPEDDSPSAGGGYLVPPDDRGPVDQLARGTGLAARGFIQNALGLPMMGVNAGIGIGNLINRATNAMGLTDAAPFPSGSEVTDRALTSLGFAQPETEAERVATDIFGAATGAGGVAKLAEKYGPGLASTIERAVVERMSQGQGGQVVAGGAGGGAASMAREAGGGPVSQFAAGLVGSLVPQGVPFLAQSGARGFFRGGDAQSYGDRLATFRGAGVTNPTVGQAAGTAIPQTIESGLAKTPGGNRIMTDVAAGQASDMGAQVDALANQYLPGANATKAGLTITKGIANFVDRFRAGQKFLYDKLDQYVPRDTIIPADNTLAKLAELSTPTPGAEATSALIRTPRIGAVSEALASDVAAKPSQPILGALLGPDGKPIITGQTLATPGGIPYQALKALRSAVGEKITNPTLTDDISTQQWKQVYGALSDDLGAAAASAGPDATQAFNRANAYTKAGHARISGILDKVVGGQQTTAEQVFQAATNPATMQQGGTVVSTVMKSLEPNERNAVTAAVIKRMGRTKPGQQIDPNDTSPFSSETFLTSWNAMSPQAKIALFPQDGLRQALDTVASASGMNRQGSRVFANPSGTTPAATVMDTAKASGVALLTGHPLVATGILSTVPIANISARLMTNQRFVSWLAKTTQMPPALLPAQINQITQYANKNFSAQDNADLQAYLNGMQQ